MMKRSLQMPNVANRIRRHVGATWPELVTDPIPDVWFTGSQVWLFLYPDLPRRDPPLVSDWDIFTIGEDSSSLVVARLDLSSMPSCLTRDKRYCPQRTICDRHVPRLAPPSDGVHPGGYEDGYAYTTPRGELDLWVSATGSAVDELRTYPDESHDHCRAAYSVTDGLIILPNDRVYDG